MKSKKILSMFLALVMALALAVPAFAEDVKVEGSINLPTINVVLPTSTSMIMNPYQLEVKLNPKDANETPSTEQIISPLMTVKNLSNIGVQVGVTVAGTVTKGSTATLATAKLTGGNSTDKEAFVYVKFLIGDPDMSADDIVKGTEPTAKGDYELILAADADFPTKLDPDGTADKTNKSNILAATSDAKNPAEGGVLGFRFFGDMVSAPDDSWTDKDTLGATLSFTFTPIAGILPA